MLLMCPSGTESHVRCLLSKQFQATEIYEEKGIYKQALRACQLAASAAYDWKPQMTSLSPVIPERAAFRASGTTPGFGISSYEDFTDLSSMSQCEQCTCVFPGLRLAAALGSVSCRNGWLCVEIRRRG